MKQLLVTNGGIIDGAVDTCTARGEKRARETRLMKARVHVRAQVRVFSVT